MEEGREVAREKEGGREEEREGKRERAREGEREYDLNPTSWAASVAQLVEQLP